MEYQSKTSRKPNPKEKANPLNVIFFMYMFPIFRKFYKKEVTEDDLFDVLREHKANKLGAELEKLWMSFNQKDTESKAPLYHALFRQFGCELVVWVSINAFCHIQTILLLPMAVNGLVMYFENTSSVTGGSNNDGYFHYGVLFGSVFFRVVAGHSSVMVMNHICMKMSVACCSLIYRKSLKLSAFAVSQTTIGQIVNLLSNDVCKFDQGLFQLSNVIIGPVIISIAMYQLYRSLGSCGFFGIIFLLVFVFFQIFLGRLYSKIRLKITIRTDERLKLLNEIFSGINVIKMYTWEESFGKLVSLARRFEMKFIRLRMCIESIRNATEICLTRTAIFITIIAYLILNGTIPRTQIFYLTTIYAALRVNVGYHLPAAINSTAEAYVTINRIQSFLQYDEIDSSTITRHSKLINTTETVKTAQLPKILLNNVFVRWMHGSPNYVLQNICLNIDSNQLVALVGPVGSGKSTLLSVFLKELPVIDGSLDVCGKISFAAQEPWLFTSSIRQNILFGNKFINERYKAVLAVCALEEDLATFPYHDLTVISENGKSLSGGQRSRINLARCVYREADIYLLDDPLSAVDAEVGQYLYKHCIQQFLKDKICVLVTHQLQYLTTADNIVIMDKGSVVGQGSYEKLQNSGLNFATLLKDCIMESQEADLGKDVVQVEKMLNKTKESTSDNIQQNKIKENSRSGSVGLNSYIQYFKSGGGLVKIFCLFILFFIAQFAALFGDYYVSCLTKLNHTRNLVDATSTPWQIMEDNMVYSYSGIILLTIVFAFGHGMFFVKFVMRVSENLHKSIFQKVSCATMSFFDINPTGQILNRFSSDMGIVDGYIPVLLMEVMKLFVMILEVLVAFAIINIWHLVPFLILLVPLYISKKYYIKTSNGAKRIEAMTRGPIFNYMAATIHGLATIRASEVQNKLIGEFDDHQDLHSSAWYIFISSSRAYGLWIDFLSTVFMATVIFGFLLIEEEYDSSQIGFIVTQYLYINIAFSYLLRQVCELENYMVSVERVLDYTKLEIESQILPRQTLPKDWPEKGEIVFKAVSLRYTPDDLNVLKNLNFHINAKDKIGVVGRTGAGKSSVVSALFQMYVTEGSIIIDNVDVQTISLKELRSKISIIPQQPVLFSGTLRKNLDPLEEHSDDELWSALQQVEMKDFVENSVGGLITNVHQTGSNFSIGQKQLICFARAIISKNKILVMDEATANVDPQTNSVIQKTIRQMFADCTVITIAHRLNTIIDSDKILVMDSGCAVEFDYPFKLLRNRNSTFYKLVSAAGADTLENFITITEKRFNKSIL